MKDYISVWTHWDMVRFDIHIIVSHTPATYMRSVMSKILYMSDCVDVTYEYMTLLYDFGRCKQLHERYLRLSTDERL